MPPKTELEKTLAGGGILLPVLRLTLSLVRGSTCTFVSSRVMSAKSDNRCPSYGDPNNLKWPPSAILDYGEKRIRTIAHVGGPHWPRKYSPRTEFDNPACGGILMPF